MKKATLLLFILPLLFSCKKPKGEPVLPVYSLVKIAGDNQTGYKGKTLDTLVVQLFDELQKPVSNVNVEFNILSGGGQLGQSTAITDLQGKARVVWTLGATGQPQKVKVTVANGGNSKFTSTPVEFDASINVVNLVLTGNDQNCPFNSRLTSYITVKPEVKPGDVLKDVVIHVEVTGGGSVGDQNILTSNSGLAIIYWILGPAGEQKLEVSARTEAGEQLSSSPLVIQATGTGAKAIAATALSGIGSQVFVTNAGVVYSTDAANNQVVKWPPGATSPVTVAGGNGKGPAANQLSSPGNLYVDATGNIYIVDNDNYRVQKWAPGAATGVTVAGGNGRGPAANQINYPGVVYADAAGTVYISDYDIVSQVVKWPPGSTSGMIIYTGKETQGATTRVFGIFGDSQGNIFIGDTHYNQVLKIPTAGTSSTLVAGGTGIPFYYSYGSSPVAGLLNDRAYGPHAGSEQDQLYAPQGVFADNNGNIFIADSGNNRVQKWTPGAKQGITVLGGNGSGNAANQLKSPSKVFVSPNGTIYVADSGNDRIQKWVP